MYYEPFNPAFGILKKKNRHTHVPKLFQSGNHSVGMYAFYESMMKCQ